MDVSALSEYFKKLEATPSRNAMTETLADLFTHARGAEIGKICYLLLGRVVPLYEAVEFGVADKFMIRAIGQAYGVEASAVVALFKQVGDLGEAAQICAQKHATPREKLSVSSVYNRLLALARESGEGSQEKKITMLAELLSSVDTLSARYLARIPLDKLRLGFSDMTMLDSLSWMQSGDKSLRGALEDAYNRRPDIGFIAETLKEKGPEGLTSIKAHVGAPILAALCQRIPTADEMIKKMGEVAVEPKYDGVRVQIHYEKSKAGVKVSTYSRNLENTSAMFPELTGMGKEVNAQELVLDCEAVGIDRKNGKLIPFQETMTRKRKHGIEAASESVPLKFFVFDILYKDGKDLLSEPLSSRRKILEKTLKPVRLFLMSPQIVTRNAAELRAYHDAQLKKGLEGAVVKKWDSPYEPGRRGYSWVKFKEEEGKTGKLTDTIDAVIMGYSRGEGKRSGFGIGMFLVGVAKGDEFVTITKIGTGVSDELWKDLRKKLDAIEVREKPKQYAEVNKLFTPDVWVAPKIVVEIAGDDLTKSPTHGAGVAVRFPRLVRIRTDKSPKDATTTAEVQRMFHSQKQSHV